jgi:succinate dehydrogenase / fumarate reductase cytochrome b subunit
MSNATTIATTTPSAVSDLASVVSSSIGTKALMALSGFGLSAFLITHLAGNLLVLVGPEAYNGYAAALEASPLLGVAELALATMFLLHIGLAVSLTLANRAARPQAYEVHRGKGGRNRANSTMAVTGAIVLAFVVLHLITFKFHEYRRRGPDGRPGMTWVLRDGREVKDFHRRVVTVFASPGYVVWYLFAVSVLGLHVSHGIQSALRSLGLYADSHGRTIRGLSLGFGGAMAGGYAVIPLWAHFFAPGSA